MVVKQVNHSVERAGSFCARHEVSGFVAKLYATCERLLITSSKHRSGTLKLGSNPSMSLKGEKSLMVVLW